MIVAMFLPHLTYDTNKIVRNSQMAENIQDLGTQKPRDTLLGFPKNVSRKAKHDDESSSPFGE